MLTETVIHRSCTGQDAYGKPTYGGAVNRPARIAYQLTTVMTAQGGERVSTTVVYCDGDFAITLRDKLTLPDGTSPVIQAIYSPTDPTQPGTVDHHELRL